MSAEQEENIVSYYYILLLYVVVLDTNIFYIQIIKGISKYFYFKFLKFAKFILK